MKVSKKTSDFNSNYNIAYIDILDIQSKLVQAQSSTVAVFHYSQRPIKRHILNRIVETHIFVYNFQASLVAHTKPKDPAK